MTTIIVSSQKNSVSSELLRSALLFGIPMILTYISFWYGRPFFVSLGLTEYEAFVVSLTVPLSLLLVAALVGFAIEKDKDPDLRLQERFRYPNFEFKFLIRGIGIYLIGTFIFAILLMINIVVIDAFKISVPDNATPFFGSDTSSVDMRLFEEFVGEPLYGNYKFFTHYLVMLFFNIVGEELWWRGYILPQQEKVFGSTTWIIHGLFWNIFHLFKWWHLIAILSMTLLIPFAAQKYKENWSSMIAHLLFNGMFLVFLVPVVFF